jgi:hypothetical protein
MSGPGWRRGLVAVVAGLVLGLGGIAGQPAAQARREGSGGGPAGGGQDLYGCDRTIGRQPVGRLAERTTPSAHQTVNPGDTIEVVLVWDVHDWSARRLHKVLDCVAIDGELVQSRQGGESPTDNDGRFSRSYTVPDGVPPGAEICDQAMLSGPSPRGDYDRQISNMVCHTVSGKASAGRPPCRDRCGDGRGCSDCYQKPPSSERGGADGRGCSDCYEKPPSGDRAGQDRGCGDCYEQPPSGDRCTDKASCDRKEHSCSDRRNACERRDKGHCGCDDRDGDGSLVHRLLRHIFH